MTSAHFELAVVSGVTPARIAAAQINTDIRDSALAAERKAAQGGYPGKAIVNYLLAAAVGEMTIALTGTGLDPGIGIFHVDQVRRASLAYDAGEALRPYVDAWLVTWLASARFSKPRSARCPSRPAAP